MLAIPVCLQFARELDRCLSKRHGRIALAFVLSIVLLTCTSVGDDAGFAYAARPESASDFAVVSLPDANLRARAEETENTQYKTAKASADEATAGRKSFWSYNVFSLGTIRLTSNENASRPHFTSLTEMGRVASAARDSLKAIPRFFENYRSVMHVLALEGLHHIREYAENTRSTIVGTASTYNPFRETNNIDELRTASGEPYDPSAWTAAIQIKLRDHFRGVRFGRLYQPTYALVEAGDKKVIVKINDVGPLKPGRVIDLNERTMRYFDPSLEAGLVPEVKITPLPGEDWAPGPIGVLLAG